jgi:hypothetical protein
MRWPIEVKLGGRPPPPPEPSPRPELSPDRPSTFIELFSDLSKSRNQAATFLMTVGGVLVIATFCVAGICVVMVEAAKGVKGVPLYVLPAGISGASLLTLITTILTRLVRRLGRSVTPGPVDEGADHRRADS